jgi:hypothetical protein
VLFVSGGYERQVWASHASLRAHKRLLAECADRVVVAGFDRRALPGLSEQQFLGDPNDLDPDHVAALIRAELAT